MHARADAPETAPNWPDDIFAALQRFDVRQVPYVPDAGHSRLIERVLDSSTMRGIPLTTEEEGVALLAGAWAGGQRGVDSVVRLPLADRDKHRTGPPDGRTGRINFLPCGDEVGGDIGPDLGVHECLVLVLGCP